MKIKDLMYNLDNYINNLNFKSRISVEEYNSINNILNKQIIKDYNTIVKKNKYIIKKKLEISDLLIKSVPFKKETPLNKGDKRQNKVINALLSNIFVKTSAIYFEFIEFKEDYITIKIKIIDEVMTFKFSKDLKLLNIIDQKNKKLDFKEDPLILEEIKNNILTENKFYLRNQILKLLK